MTERRRLLLATFAGFCFGAGAVLGLATANLQDLFPGDILRPLAAVALLSLLVPALLAAFAKRAADYALIHAVAFGLVMHYLGIATLLFRLLGSHYATVAALVLPLALLLALWLALRRGHGAELTLVVTSVAAAAALAAAAPLAWYDWSYPQARLAELDIGGPRATRDSDLPDIIYLVPDRYANEAVLAEVFQLDNRGFRRALEQRGFFVAGQANANYLKTFQSLASSLNLAHIDHLRDAFGASSDLRQPVYDLLVDNRVQRELRDWGYRYVHLGGWWRPTQDNPHADQVFDGREQATWPDGGLSLTELEFAVLKRTLLPVLFPNLKALHLFGNECQRLKRQLEYLARAGDDGRPTFVFAHLMIPHSPIVMNAEGDCIPPIDYPRSGVTWEAFKKAYADYLRYLNGRLLAIFDAQQERNPNGVIFVVQADEGPFPRRYRQDLKSFDWSAATSEELRMKFGILNAIHLPSRSYARLHQALSPVNNWRIVFSELLGRDLPLLGDSSFAFADPERPHDLYDITDRIAPEQPRLGRAAGQAGQRRF